MNELWILSSWTTAPSTTKQNKKIPDENMHWIKHELAQIIREMYSSSKYSYSWSGIGNHIAAAPAAHALNLTAEIAVGMQIMKCSRVNLAGARANNTNIQRSTFSNSTMSPNLDSAWNNFVCGDSGEALLDGRKHFASKRNIRWQVLEENLFPAFDLSRLKSSKWRFVGPNRWHSNPNHTGVDLNRSLWVAPSVGRHWAESTDAQNK